MSASGGWEIDLIMALQALGGAWGLELARLFTFLGNQEFFLLAIPFLFWCVDTATGARVAVLYLLSATLNTDLKEWWQAARPYILHPEVALIPPESVYGAGYGMPSGHAQWTLVVWGALALQVRRGWFWVIALLIPIMVGLSRVYLGVHFPTQILAGWAIGLATLFMYMLLRHPFEAWVAARGTGFQAGLAVLLPAVLIAFHPAADVVAAMAVLTGLGLGLSLAYRPLAAANGDAWWQRLARYGVGIIVLLGLYVGLAALFPAEGEAFHGPLRAVRYGLLGLWISLGAPWFFSRVRLAPAAPQPV